MRNIDEIEQELRLVQTELAQARKIPENVQRVAELTDRNYALIDEQRAWIAKNRPDGTEAENDGTANKEISTGSESDGLDDSESGNTSVADSESAMDEGEGL